MKSKQSFSLSVVLPTYNDGKTLPVIVKKLARLLPTFMRAYEVIIVNDGSKDNTKTVAVALQKQYPYIRIIDHKNNQGYGAAVWDGFSHAKKEFVFYTDSDGQYDVGELSKLIASMDAATDIVTGYKKKRSDSLSRKWIGALYNQCVRIIFWLPVKDVDCDFRLFRRRILKGVTMPRGSGAFDVLLLTQLCRKKIRIKEIPVSHYPRIHGKSEFFTFSRVGQTIIDILWARWYFLFH